MTQIAKYLTPTSVERMVGLQAGSIDSFAWLVMQEQGKGVGIEVIAKGLEVDVAEINGLADSVTGGPGGIEHEAWKACVVSIKSIMLANQNIIGHGWDALEAMAVDRLATLVADSGGKMSTKDAVAIAALANKATRRNAGEGGGPRTSIHVKPPSPGQEGEMALELQGGHLGSIRLSLSTRIQSQLTQPKVIEAEANGKAERRMLTVEEIRNVESK